MLPEPRVSRSAAQVWRSVFKEFPWGKAVLARWQASLSVSVSCGRTDLWARKLDRKDPSETFPFSRQYMSQPPRRGGPPPPPPLKVGSWGWGWGSSCSLNLEPSDRSDAMPGHISSTHTQTFTQINSRCSESLLKCLINGSIEEFSKIL